MRWEGTVSRVVFDYKEWPVHLLREVEKFLRQTDVPPTRFGRIAMGDPRFVFDLRKGRDPRPETIARVRLPGGGAMLKIAMSPTASALLRALLERAGAPRDRILLTSVRSTDWQSLTFIGERHEIQLRIPGAGSGGIAERLCAGLGEAEFDIPGQIVAEIRVRGGPRRQDDGAVQLDIEALTIEE